MVHTEPFVLTVRRHMSSTSVDTSTGSLASLVALVQSAMAVSRLDMEVALSSTMHASSYISRPRSLPSLMKRALPARACSGFLVPQQGQHGGAGTLYQRP